MKRHEDALNTFAVLLRAADEDPKLQAEIRALVALPAQQRRSVVNRSLQEMAARGEPDDVRDAFALLATDAGANTVRHYLTHRSS